MTAIFPILRRIDSDAGARARISTLCGRLGVRLHWLRPPADTPMLAFVVSTAQVRMRGRILAGRWYASVHPELADIAWDALILSDTPPCPDPGQGRLQFDAWPLEPVRIEQIEQVERPATRGIGKGAPHPALAIAQGMFWVDSLELQTPQNAPELMRIPAAVDFHLASIRLPLCRMRSITQGAIVLFETLDPHGRIDARRIFNYDFTVENCTVTHTFDFTDDDDALDGMDPLLLPERSAPAQKDLRFMPVVIEVVLCRSSRHLQDLAELQPGAVFDLPVDAWQSLELRVNGARIATGELVQVGERLGVQITQRLAIA